MYVTKYLPAGLLAGLASAQSMSLDALLQSNNDLSSLRTLLMTMPTISNTLMNATNITLLAPSNNAIQQLRRSGLLGVASTEQVTALLDYHVVPGMIYAQNITSTPQFCPTMLNNSMYANVTGGQVVEAENIGNQTTTFISGLKAMSNVTQANLKFKGGVLHIIDQVLTIPYSVSSTALAANLTGLAGALEATNLTDTVDGLKDITVFAPLTSAFSAIGNLALNLTTQQLTNILEYHVINGTVGYSTALSAGSIKALNGDNLHIRIEDDAIFVNAARVVNSNILVGGGVMHIIDSVLNPNDTSIKPKPSATTPVVQFSSATAASSLPFTSGLTVTTTVSALVATTETVAAGQTQGSGGGNGNGNGGSSSTGLAPAPTGVMAAAALFGGGAMLANW